MILKLKDGNVIIELFNDVAPNHVKRFKKLSEEKKYDGVVFHRVIDGFMAQTGDVQFGNSSLESYDFGRAGTGGSDYPDWYLKYGGQVLSTTIDKHIYITCRYLPPFFKHKHRFIWSKIEQVNNLNQVQHPMLKSALKYFKINKGIEVHYDGDLPGNSGIGSSSSFCVGLINAIFSKKKIIYLKKNYQIYLTT